LIRRLRKNLFNAESCQWRNGAGAQRINSGFSFVAATVKKRKLGGLLKTIRQELKQEMSSIRNVIEQNSGRARRPLPWHRLAKRMHSKPVVLPLVWLEHADNTHASNAYSRLDKCPRYLSSP
jgi:hypothetical protein